MKYLLALSIFLTSNLYGACVVPCYESYLTNYNEQECVQHNLFGLQNLEKSIIIPIFTELEQNHRICLIGSCSTTHKIYKIDVLDKEEFNIYGSIEPKTNKPIMLKFDGEPGEYILKIHFVKCSCEDCKCTPNNHCGCLD